tara:strand:- start:655 stop:837 length:183 start_codon:yes stop_codon:yes gene_type:complete
VNNIVHLNLIKAVNMTKKISPANNQANQQNPNKGTDGVNQQYAKVQGNRGKQLNKNEGKK